MVELFNRQMLEKQTVDHQRDPHLHGQNHHCPPPGPAHQPKLNLPRGRGADATRPGTFDNTTTLAVLECQSPNKSNREFSTTKAHTPTSLRYQLTNRRTSLANSQFSARVPQTKPWTESSFHRGPHQKTPPKRTPCQGPDRAKFATSVNNVYFAMRRPCIRPITMNSSVGVYTTDFQHTPTFPFNYSG